MRDAFRECPVKMHQKSQKNRRIPLSKNLATKGNAQHCVAYRNRIEENHKVHYIRKSCTMLALQSRFTIIFQVCLVVFLGSMRCKSGSANKSKHHVSCVLPPSHLRISLQFKLHQERIKICNPQPKNVLWEIILGVLEMPCTPQKSKWAAARTIHPTCTEAGNELKNI